MATTNAQNKIASVKKTINPTNLINVGFPVFLKNTPIRSGNARAHTTKSATEINAKYPYAQRLDNGWSKQSPDGMVKPTIEAIRAYIKKQLGV